MLTPNPTPINADLPLSSWMRSTKYRELSETASIAIPGYASTGQFAKSWPEILSSNLMLSCAPVVTIRILPFHVGSFRFQSAALKRDTLSLLWGKSSTNSLLMIRKKNKNFKWKRNFSFFAPIAAICGAWRYLIDEDLLLHEHNTFISRHYQFRTLYLRLQFQENKTFLWTIFVKY